MKSSNAHTFDYHALLRFQREILSDVALSLDSKEIFDRVCVAGQDLSPHTLACVLLFNKQGTALKLNASPTMPIALWNAFDGLPPGGQGASCGEAVFSGKASYVANTHVDASWLNLRDVAKDFDIKACWSTPIKAQDEVIGTFTLLSSKPGKPNDFQKLLLESSAHICSVVIQRQVYDQAVWQTAHQDPLTGLPNRNLLINHIEQSFTLADRYNQLLALLFIDLDNFKQCNDHFGHEIGDTVLLEISQRIRACTRSTDMLCRLGGDEFLLALEPISNPISAWHVGLKIIDAIQQPFSINGQNQHLSASIGISLYPKDGTTTKELFKHADMAMYQAKQQLEKDHIVFYEHSLSVEMHQRLALEREIKQAIKTEQFELVFQPAYAGQNKKIISIETLLRWKSPTRGVVSPSEFIPIAEESILIHQIGDWVIKKTCATLSAWLKNFKSIPCVSLNVSALQIQKGFTDKLAQALQAHKVPPQAIELEIAEHSLMKTTNFQAVVDELSQLKTLGVSIALDNFGTGHTSLEQLLTLPITKLKIDRRFIINLLSNKKNATITQTIISMGKNLNIQVMAEGIESQEQKDFLIQHGCEFLQGFYLDCPMNAAELETRFN